VSIPSDFPLLWVAAELIEQMFINLQENAVRYTPGVHNYAPFVDVTEADYQQVPGNTRATFCDLAGTCPF
jgi:signal transduction histidine kinase